MDTPALMPRKEPIPSEPGPSNSELNEVRGWGAELEDFFSIVISDRALTESD